MPSTTRTLADRLAKLTRALPENDPAMAMHRGQRDALRQVLELFAGLCPQVELTVPELDGPAVPGYDRPTNREMLGFVRAELAAITDPAPIPSERVFVQCFLWVHFLELLNAPPPDPPQDCPKPWQQLTSQPLRPS